MTLGEGKHRVLMLLNEYSGGGALTLNEDLSARMANFFDIAQKEVAEWQPLMRLDRLPHITPLMSDDYEFPLTESAANCLPLFVASHLVSMKSEARALYNLYLQMRSMLPHDVYGGGGGYGGNGGNGGPTTGGGSGGSWFKNPSSNIQKGAGGGGAPDWRLIKARRALGLPVSMLM